MKSYLLALGLISQFAYAGVFDNEYTCLDYKKAKANYDSERIEEILSSSFDEATPKIHEFYGGKDKFESKAKGKHPQILYGIATMTATETGGTKLCDPKLGYNDATLISDIYVDMFNGRYSETIDKVNSVAREQRNSAVKKQEMLIEKTEAENKARAIEMCIASIKPFRGRPKADNYVKVSQDVVLPDGVVQTVGKDYECTSFSEVNKIVKEKAKEVQLAREQAEKQKKEEKEAKRMVALCKNKLKHSNYMTNVYSLKDFFQKNNCTDMAQEALTEYKERLKAHNNGKTLKRTLTTWEKEDFKSLSKEANQFYIWLKAEAESM